MQCQRQSTFALTPSVATTSTVCAKGWCARSESWVLSSRGDFPVFLQSRQRWLSTEQLARAASCKPRARRRALTEQQQQPLPSVRCATLQPVAHGLSTKIGSFFKTKASSYVPSTRASSRASLDKNDKSNAKIDTHLTPGLILTVFDLCLPVNKIIPVPVLFRFECIGILESKKKNREMAGSRITLWDLTRKKFLCPPKVVLLTGSGIALVWSWNRMQNNLSDCNWLVIVQKLCICLFVCLFVCFVYIFLHYLNLRCSAEI